MVSSRGGGNVRPHANLGRGLHGLFQTYDFLKLSSSSEAGRASYIPINLTSVKCLRVLYVINAGRISKFLSLSSDFA